MISPHRLPRPSYDAVCAGAPDRAALEVVSAGQLSKHLMLLRLVLDLLPGAVTRGGPVADALALLELVRDRHRSAFESVIAYPYVGAGLIRCMRQAKAGQGPGPVTLFLAAVAASAAVRAGEDFVLDGIPLAGPVHLPTLGTAQVDPESTVASFSRDGDRVRLAGVSLPWDLGQDGARWSGIRSLSSKMGGDWPVLDDLAPDRAVGDMPAAPRLPADRFAEWHDVFAAAVQRLHDGHPERAAQVGRVLRTLTPLRAERPGQGRSASAWQAYGAVAATLPGDPAGFAATLIHETQHSILNGLLDLFDLYDAEDQSLHYSPWRADARPLRGVLHGAYAFVGVVDFWARESGRRAEFELARTSLQLRRALETLDGSPALTADGQHLVSQMTRHLDRVETGGLPDRIAHLAGLANEDHRLSWRLRIVVPDRGLVEELARAWRGGHAATSLVDDDRHSTSAETFVPNERIRRLSRLAQPAGGEPLPMPAEDAFLVDREYAAARRGYAEAVRTGAGDLAAWTGLALAGSHSPGPAAELWRRRPELVRALFGELRGELRGDTGPVELAEWLAGGLRR